MTDRYSANEERSIFLHDSIRKWSFLAGFAASFVFLASLPVHAQALRLIPFQARMTDSSGNALNGVYSVTFSIYDAATGGTAQWVEPHPNVSIVGGQLNVFLGSIRSLDDANGDSNPNDPVDFGASASAKFVGITIGTGSEMVPRHQLVPAFHARTADVASVVKDGAITAVMLAPGAVTADKILDGSIGPADLQAAPFITGANLVSASVASAQIQDGAILGAKLDPALLASIDASAQMLNVQVELRKTAYLKDYKSSNSSAQNLANGPVGSQRILNTIEGDSSFVSLSGGTIGVNGTANQFVLQPGTYEVEGWASSMRTNDSAIRIINVATGLPLIDYQHNGWSSSASNNGVSPALLQGTFSLASSATLAMQHRILIDSPEEAGNSADYGSNEMYASLKIVKVERRTIADMIANP